MLARRDDYLGVSVKHEKIYWNEIHRRSGGSGEEGCFSAGFDLWASRSEDPSNGSEKSKSHCASK